MENKYNAQDCLQILRDVKDVAFASVDENGIPQNRIIDVMIVENEKLYFCTARGKHFYNQIINNPNLAITGMNSKYKMVMLKGQAEKLYNSKEWIDRIFDENESMNDVYPQESRYILEAFCISNGELEIYDLSNTPIYRESFVIGKGEITPKGFFITEDCIQCNTCADGCPQRCITVGEPYIINSSQCLHCGLCFENCPVNAIIRK